METGAIDVAELKKLDEEWLRQLWAQVYTSLFLSDPQGFRLTDEERERLQKENEQYSKPLPGEIEITEKLHWETPVEQWNWKKTTDLIFDLGLKGINASQVGKVMSKMMNRDPRIQVKSSHNVKLYYVPPHWIRDFEKDEAVF